METITLLFMLIALGITLISALKKHPGITIYFLQFLMSAAAIVMILTEPTPPANMLLMVIVPFACLAFSVSGIVGSVGDKHA